ncbi:metalloregulator ArsR/SmtB family transcription factor [Nitratireductor sp. CAU 1489]|uniref:Metalloregulator ArsR/SmtB family transcription factor n=1 Tax=Nitratireductor arenosus TaxID=2682096 RepID=A0A844QK63_9HYPH|nr:metalloregulator ArsR/SmtB family transcription factor [Nitratireductor arenosus]MVA99647.1 metalloregulator ArsR/SmtB family transcription factor [Nitratireductor arenosus]
MNNVDIPSKTAGAATDLPVLAAGFAALAHPARLRILCHLARRDACCCREIVDTFELAQSTVSQHLKVLVDAGLVHYRPENRRSRYMVDREAVARLEEQVSTFLSCCHV